MANTIRYIGFNTQEKRRVSLAGGSVMPLPKLILNRGDTYEFRFFLYKDAYQLYTQTGGTWTLQLREKRQSLSTADLAEASDAAFVDATWATGQVSRINTKYPEGVFQEGDRIYGYTSGAIGYVLDYSKQTGVIIYSVVSGTWASGELIKVTDGGGGYSGVEARATSTATALIGAKVSGYPICTMSLEVAALNTLLADKEFVNGWLELTETNTAVVKVIGQCEVRINNTFDL